MSTEPTTVTRKKNRSWNRKDAAQAPKSPTTEGDDAKSVVSVSTTFSVDSSARSLSEISLNEDHVREHIHKLNSTTLSLGAILRRLVSEDLEYVKTVQDVKARLLSLISDNLFEFRMKGTANTGRYGDDIDLVFRLGLVDLLNRLKNFCEGFHPVRDEFKMLATNLFSMKLLPGINLQVTMLHNDRNELVRHLPLVRCPDARGWLCCQIGRMDSLSTIPLKPSAHWIFELNPSIIQLDAAELLSRRYTDWLNDALDHTNPGPLLTAHLYRVLTSPWKMPTFLGYLIMKVCVPDEVRGNMPTFTCSRAVNALINLLFYLTRSLVPSMEDPRLTVGQSDMLKPCFVKTREYLFLALRELHTAHPDYVEFNPLLSDAPDILLSQLCSPYQYERLKRNAPNLLNELKLFGDIPEFDTEKCTMKNAIPPGLQALFTALGTYWTFANSSPHQKLYTQMEPGCYIAIATPLVGCMSTCSLDKRYSNFAEIGAMAAKQTVHKDLSKRSMPQITQAYLKTGLRTLIYDAIRRVRLNGEYVLKYITRPEHNLLEVYMWVLCQPITVDTAIECMPTPFTVMNFVDKYKKDPSRAMIYSHIAMLSILPPHEDNCMDMPYNYIKKSEEIKINRDIVMKRHDHPELSVAIGLLVRGIGFIEDFLQREGANSLIRRRRPKKVEGKPK